MNSRNPVDFKCFEPENLFRPCPLIYVLEDFTPLCWYLDFNIRPKSNSCTVRELDHATCRLAVAEPYIQAHHFASKTSGENPNMNMKFQMPNSPREFSNDYT